MARAAKNGNTPPGVLSQLAEDVLPTLIARLDSSRLGELEVRQDGWRIRLRRADPTEAVPIPTPSRRQERKPDGPTESRPQQLRPSDRGMAEVASPAVGYYTPLDGLAVGNTVRAGDVIGNIDVLGVRVEVVVPEDGLISAIEAQPGEAVEYGQSVARLERKERRT